MMIALLSLPPYVLIPIVIVVLLAAFVLGFFTAKLYFTDRQNVLIGHDAEVIDWQTRKKRVMVFGEIWNANSHAKDVFKKGDIVVIVARDNLCLHIAKKG